MSELTYEATVVGGQIRLIADVALPENSKVLVIVQKEGLSPISRLRSPRLAHPEQANDFELEVQEIGNAGV